MPERWPPPIIPPPEPGRSEGLKTQAERAGEQARTAVEAGRAALARGDAATAIRLLERALRYAPRSPEALLSLAAAQFASGAFVPAEALFRSLAETHDVREAWLGAAVANLRLGRPENALSTLHACLSRHRWDGNRDVADAVTRAAGASGWCALAADATVAIGPPTSRDCVIRVDGEVVATASLVPARATRIEVARNGASLVGSPIDAALIQRVEGAVRVRDDGIEGWAWHPGDAARDPTLLLSDRRHEQSLTATDQAMPSLVPLARPRRFALGSAEMAAFSGPIVVSGPDGRELIGSPVDPAAPARVAAEQARAIAAAWPLHDDALAPRTLSPPGPKVVVVVPAYRGRADTLACLDALRRTLPSDCAVLVVDDASPEADLVSALQRRAEAGTIRLLRLAANRGFPAAANAGLRAGAALSAGADLVLLNSDTVPAAGWLQRLRDAVHGTAAIGTATPLSNDATILSYPDPTRANAVASAAELSALARDAARANPGTTVDVPTAVGFCMYIRRACLEQTGVLREDVFAQGYGEENDFCRRAAALRWRHVAVPGAYVAHVGGRSFGAARGALLERNMAVLERLHPGYQALIAAWIARDPLRGARRRLDALRWRRLIRDRRPAVLLVTHDSGGGVEHCVQARAEALQAAGRRPVLLRPVIDRSEAAALAERRYRPGWCRIEDTQADLPNLVFQLPDELAELASLLRLAGVERMEVHHLLGHDHAVVDLARLLTIPYDIRLHDYAWFCPRISLLGGGDRYCGEPDPTGCAQCVDDLGSRLEEEISVPDLLHRSAGDLAGAAEVIAPSNDAAQRLARHFPGLRVRVEPHERDKAATDDVTLRSGRPRSICVVGAIGAEKGYGVLLACARDAARRGLPLRFVVVGHTIDDERLLRTGRIDVTGPFKPEEAVSLIRAQEADAGFIPSIWPETWCLALGEVWRAGLAAVAFDIGAPAERIRATGRGWILPLGLSPARVNDTLLSLQPLRQQVLAPAGGVMQTA